MRGGKLHWKRKLKNKFTRQRLLQKIEKKNQEDSCQLQDNSIKQTCLRHEKSADPKNCGTFSQTEN